MLIDDIQEMLARCKNAVATQGPHVLTPDPADNASIKVQLDLEKDRLTQEMRQRRDAFIENLTLPQRTAWNAYQEARAIDWKTPRPQHFKAKNTTIKLKRDFVASLGDDEQLFEYQSIQQLQNALRNITQEIDRIEMFDVMPSAYKCMANIAFPESFSPEQNVAVHDILLHMVAVITNQGDKHFLELPLVMPIKFHPVNQGNNVIRLKFEIAPHLEQNLPEIFTAMELYAKTGLRTRLADPTQWKKTRSEKGTVYYHTSKLDLNDPILAAALQLSLRKSLNNEVERGFIIDGNCVTLGAYYQSPTMMESHPRPTQYIKLWGNAAKHIIQNELGIRLAEIREKPLGPPER